jgi:hypothetical protein
LSLIAGAFLPALAAGNVQAQASPPVCDAAGEIAFLPSPWAPWKGAPMRVMLVTEKPLQGELSRTGPDGSVAAEQPPPQRPGPSAGLGATPSGSPERLRIVLGHSFVLLVE